jgi:hypothetical protein
VTTSDPYNEPLSRATLQAVSLADPAVRFESETDRNGHACLDHLPEGFFWVEATRSGFLHMRYYPVRVEFPKNTTLTFRLPLGEITEGMGLTDATLSGTLSDRGKPADGVTICLLTPAGLMPIACTVTNELGQYALEKIQPGNYRIELSRSQERLSLSTIDLSHPGVYRDRVKIEK